MTSSKGAVLVTKVSLKDATNNAGSPSQKVIRICPEGLADFPVMLSLHGSGSMEVEL
jgi:hypothetical protein